MYELSSKSIVIFILIIFNENKVENDENILDIPQESGQTYGQGVYINYYYIPINIPFFVMI